MLNKGKLEPMPSLISAKLPMLTPSRRWGRKQDPLLKPQVDELMATIHRIGEAKKGMTIALDWTGKATQLVGDGKPTGKPIEGEDFYRALLRIWLGEKPVQDDVKKALLGAQ